MHTASNTFADEEIDSETISLGGTCQNLHLLSEAIFLEPGSPIAALDNFGMMRVNHVVGIITATWCAGC